MDKKIGIMSMQRIINYGSFLQAYGLKKMIESVSKSEVEFIDYRFGVDITNRLKKPQSKAESIVDKILKNRTPWNYLKKKNFFKEMYLKEKSVDIEELEGLNFREKTSFGLRSVGKNNGFPRIVDMYTYAFLKSIDYTENCYSCRYASQSRVSDISLGDSWGSELSEEEKKKGISLVLCQTKKGDELLKKSNVELFDAVITRAIQLNHQLEYPSRIPSSRMFFFENLEKGFDFAMKKILPKEYLKNEIKIILSKVGIRR